MPNIINTRQVFPAAGPVLPKAALFIIDGVAAPDTRDAEIKTLLEANGWTVDYIEDSDYDSPLVLLGYGVLLISHSLVEGSVVDDDAALGWPGGIVWLGTRLDVDNGIEALGTDSGGEENIYVTDVSHPVTSFLGSAGLYRVYQSGTVLVETSTAADPAGTILARRDDALGAACMWYYDVGDTRPVGGGTFAGRRFITWVQGQGGQRLDCSACAFRGQTLLLNALDWVTYRI